MILGFSKHLGIFRQANLHNQVPSRDCNVLLMLTMMLLFTSMNTNASSEPSIVALFNEDPTQVVIIVEDHRISPIQILKVKDHTHNTTNSTGSDQSAVWQGTLVAPKGVSVEKLLLAARQHPTVMSAERNYPAKLNLTPNDAVFTDSSANTSHHQQINSEEAWDIRTDCRSVVVAIVDTGADQNHPDLANNLWINSNEIAGNGIDDDNNGYIDDINGACVRTDCAAGEIEDNFGHGSHVAGLLAAEGNNQIGVTGVCWDAKLMIIKSLGDTGSGSTSDVAAGINYAVNNGADIINTSLTISNYSSALESATEQAEQNGILMIAAAGNFESDNDQTPVYPANFRTSHDNLMSIANVDLTDSLYRKSNYGLSTVDVGAPGVNLFSTWKDAQYASSTGTSMAAPIVSGIAALLMSEGTNQNDLETKARLLSSARVAEALEWQVITPGVVNAYDALSAINSTPLTLFRAQPNSGSYQLHGYDLSNVDLVRYTEVLTGGQASTDITSFEAQDASHIQLSLPATSKSGLFTLFRGSEQSNQIFIKRTIAAPTDVSFERSGESITLSWNTPQNADVISIERGVPGQVFQEIATVAAPNSVYQDSIGTEQRYYYRLRGSYDYIDPSTNAEATEYSTYSSTLITSPDDDSSFWLTEGLPNIGVNSVVSLQLTATSSGVYSLADGSLPTGLSLSSSGLLSGTASAQGNYDFVINFQPSGSNQIDSRTFSMTVTSASAGSMQLTDQQSLTLTVSSSSGTLSAIQALDKSNFETLDNVSVQLVQQILISNLPITAAETSEITISLANGSDGQLDDIYIADTNNQWQNSAQTSNTQVSSSTASVLIEDGSEFDLDNQVNGEIVARIASTSTNNSTESSSSSDSRCFIASAVYSSEHQDLQTLRYFRDHVLTVLPGGDHLISAYYHYSPQLVAWMKHHPRTLETTRSLLELTAMAIRNPLTLLSVLFAALLGVILALKVRKLKFSL